MGSCIGKDCLSDDDQPEKRNHLIIDVQQYLADDAWEEFVFSSRRTCMGCIRGRPRPRLKRSDYTIEVPMNYYHFEEMDQKFSQKKAMPSLKARAASIKGQTSKSPIDGIIPDQLGLKTEFKNDTDKDQTYNFRMGKTRTATVQVSYQKGFSIGGAANFTLGLPKVLEGGELSAEINATYEVTSSREQTFEETLTTEATSEIIVSKKQHCTATVIMEERRLVADFTLHVKMEMPEKEAVVLIKNKLGRTVFIKVIQNLSLLFPEETHIKENGQIREDAIKFTIHGFVDGMQLSNHYIHLKSRDLPPEEKTTKRKAVPKRDSSPEDVDRSTDFSVLKQLGHQQKI